MSLNPDPWIHFDEQTMDPWATMQLPFDHNYGTTTQPQQPYTFGYDYTTQPPATNGGYPTNRYGHGSAQAGWNGADPYWTNHGTPYAYAYAPPAVQPTVQPTMSAATTLPPPPPPGPPPPPSDLSLPVGENATSQAASDLGSITVHELEENFDENNDILKNIFDGLDMEEGRGGGGAEAAAEIERISSENLDLRSELARVRASCKAGAQGESTEELTTLRAEIEEMRAKLAHVETERERENEKNERDGAEFFKRMDELHDRQTKKDEKIKELESELLFLKKKEKAERDSMAALSNQLQLLVTEGTAQNKILHDEEVNMKKEVTSLTQRRMAFMRHNNSIRQGGVTFCADLQNKLASLTTAAEIEWAKMRSSLKENKKPKTVRATSLAQQPVTTNTSPLADITASHQKTKSSPKQPLSVAHATPVSSPTTLSPSKKKQIKFSGVDDKATTSTPQPLLTPRKVLAPRKDISPNESPDAKRMKR